MEEKVIEAYRFRIDELSEKVKNLQEENAAIKLAKGSAFEPPKGGSGIVNKSGVPQAMLDHFDKQKKDSPAF